MPMPLVLVVKKAVNNRSAFSVLGFTVLTANIVDFDILLQLLPAGRVLLYRRKH
jgi:hypothetical protein